MSVNKKIQAWLKKKNIDIVINPSITLFGIISFHLGEINTSPDKWTNKQELIIKDFLQKELQINFIKFKELLKNEINNRKMDDIKQALITIKKDNKSILFSISNLKEDLSEFKEEILSELQNISNKEEIKWLNKRDFNDKIINELESRPPKLKVIVMGPYFLHPSWVIEQRLKIEDRPSYSLALQNYFIDTQNYTERDVKIIIRNSKRYLKYIEELNISDKIPILIDDMKNNLDKIFPKSKSDLLEFCCHDPGYFSGLIITDKSCFISIRMGDDTPLQGGYCLNIQNNLSKRMLNFFNDMFKNNYRGKSEEYAILIEFIEGLQEHFSVT